MSNVNESNQKSRKRKYNFPHTFVILFFIIVVVSLSTYIIPAGQFEKILNETTGIVTIDASSYNVIESSPISFFNMFLSIQKGFVNAGSVIFLIFFAYFCIFSITKSGAFHGMINSLLKILKGKESLIIPIFMIIFGIAGSTYGEWDTIYGLIPIFVGLAIALGYDAMVGLAMSGMAVAIGFASATTNPFTLGIAQSIGELPIFSGIVYRWFVFVVFMALGIWWTMRYANKIKKDPDKSLVKDIDFGSLNIDSDELDKAEFNFKHKLIMLTLVATIGFIVYSSLTWYWYIDEMAAIFLISGLIVSLIAGFNFNKIAENFIEACQGMIIGAMVVGLSRTILVILQSSNIIDTVIYNLYIPLRNLPSWAAAEGMLIVQNILNLFIPSGSGQAAAVMPIMIPLADLVGITRQSAVLAYQFGDGYSNLFWPTGGIVVMVGIAKIPLERWYKFFLPLFGIMFIATSILLIASVVFNYGPF
jgi:uncharacterized ion transporter superfamily protein YfcC